MGWIFICLVLIVSSVAMSLFLRAGQKNGITQPVANFIMFAIPAVIFGVMAFSSQAQVLLPGWQMGFIFLTAVVFGYGGYDLFLRSMEHSPNAGYPSVVSKSYVVFTSLLSVALFNATFSWLSALGILAILFFTIVLGHQSKNKTGTNRKWLLYALGTCFLWGGWALVSTQVTRWGINQTVYLFWRDLFVAFFAFLAMARKNISFSPVLKNRSLLIFIGVSSAIVHLSMQWGFRVAPNPGYVNSVNAASGAFVTLFSAYFFNEELKLHKLAAIFGIILGLGFMFV